MNMTLAELRKKFLFHQPLSPESLTAYDLGPDELMTAPTQ
jgi:hypothetical protein